MLDVGFCMVMQEDAPQVQEASQETAAPVAATSLEAASAMTAAVAPDATVEPAIAAVSAEVNRHDSQPGRSLQQEEAQDMTVASQTEMGVPSSTAKEAAVLEDSVAAAAAEDDGPADTVQPTLGAAAQEAPAPATQTTAVPVPSSGKPPAVATPWSHLQCKSGAAVSGSAAAAQRYSVSGLSELLFEGLSQMLSQASMEWVDGVLLGSGSQRDSLAPLQNATATQDAAAVPLAQGLSLADAQDCFRSQHTAISGNPCLHDDQSVFVDIGKSAVTPARKCIGSRL